MKTMNYKELDVWQQTRALVKMAFEVSEKFPTNHQFGLTNQIRRSAISIPSNIAEGIGRQGKKETLAFLSIARGSLYEFETQVFLAFGLNLIDVNTQNHFLKHIETCLKLLNGLIKYFKNSNLR
jgi:four helix bundle protein